MQPILYVRLNFPKQNTFCVKPELMETCGVTVDTGASSSCIHSALQEHFNLQVKGTPFDAAGASEGKMKAVMTKKCAFILDDINGGSMLLSS